MERKHLKILRSPFIEVMSLNIQPFFRWGTFALLLLGGCKIADLSSPPMLRQLEENQSKAIQILGNPAQPFSPEVWTANLEDEWESEIIRWMTPLSKSKERIDLQFQTGWTPSKISGQLYQDGKPSRVITPESGSLSKTYLESLSLYVQFPIVYKKFPKLALSHHEKINNKSYSVIYASQSSWEAKELEDQYLLYIQDETKTLDFVKFTYRDMLKNYVGVLKFENYQKFGNLNYPTLISILDSIDDKNFIHRLRISEIRLSK
jgi:hypothetical protein